MRIRVGSLDDLQARGCLVAKAGAHGVCVFWHEGRAFALDDRCPHLGFPLHRGTVGDGLVTCHWHNARFDLATGGTLDPFADDARPYPVVVEGGDVFVVAEPESGDRGPYFRARLEEALEQGLTLVAAKAVLGLLEAGEPPAEIVRLGVRFGTANRDAGWGAGLTVLVAMANLLPHLDVADRPVALVHGLAFVSRDTRGRPPNFPLTPLPGVRGASEGTAPPGVGPERLAAWYRRFIETRSPAAAERTLVTALAAGAGPEAVEPMVFAPVTDHLFLDEGHTADFTNKAFEALEHLGWEAAADVLPSLVPGTARARRHEEDGAWRHPHDLAALARGAESDLPAWLEEGRSRGGALGDADVAALGHRFLAEEPEEVIGALAGAVRAGATPEQLGRALALAGALRITRFHTANDFGDWDSAHHGFTHANALHQALRRHPSPDLLRGVIAGALRVFLDRFLNIPAARLPEADGGRPDLAELSECWDTQGGVDRAGGIAYRWLRSGGDPTALVAALGRALLSEDAGFHWFQTVEAAVRQFGAWPAGSEEGALILAGTARFLAAHTPTRRELPQVVRIATRLRRGEELYEAD